MESDSEYRAACAALYPHIDNFIEKLQGDMRKVIMNADLDAVKAIQIKHNYLNELRQLIKNEVEYDG